MPRAIKYVDAFSAAPFKGNPVAVVLDGKGLSTEEMQAISGWTNLSETTFILPATDPAKATYQLRIFTPVHELPFAGHPTLGSAHAALEAGLLPPGTTKIVQECKAGLVPIEITQSPDSGKRLFTLTLPKPKVTDLGRDAGVALQEVLGKPFNLDVEPKMIDVGPKWIVAELKSVQDLLDLTPDFSELSKVDQRLFDGASGVNLYAKYDAGDKDRLADIEVRTFAPSVGINEDPVCGSGNGCVAVFRALNNQFGAKDAQGVARYTSSQGFKLGRRGQISLSSVNDGESITVGGECITSVDGTINV